MVKKVTLRQMGGSIGATIPRELSKRYHLNSGDEIFVMETERGILLTSYDPEFEKAMDTYKEGAKKSETLLMNWQNKNYE